jgi:aminomethyltransferase
VSRTGYTGEDGFEITTSAQDGPALWRALRAAGVVPCGLGARDMLRLEAAYPLWGHEIDHDTRPSDVGLARYCSAGKGEYVGRPAHEAYAAAGPQKALIGLRMASKRIAREDAEVRVSGSAVGRVTSGTFSPVRGCGIALAHVANPDRKPIRERRAELVGREAVCVAGSAEIPALFADLPFYKRGER